MKIEIWGSSSFIGLSYFRERRWTESIALGIEGFAKATRGRLGIKAKGREVVGENGSYQLKDPETAYTGNFDMENGDLRFKNAYFWENI